MVAGYQKQYKKVLYNCSLWTCCITNTDFVMNRSGGKVSRKSEIRLMSYEVRQ